MGPHAHIIARPPTRPSRVPTPSSRAPLSYAVAAEEDACNAETFASVQMVNPDSERTTLVKSAEGEPEQKLWSMSRGENWGSQRLTVYRSQYLQKLVWYYPKQQHWVVLEGYDEQKEDDELTSTSHPT